MTFFTTYKELMATINSNAILLIGSGEPDDFNCVLSQDIYTILSQNGVKFKYINAAGNPLLVDALAKMVELVSLPYLFIGGKSYGGYAAIKEGLFSGELLDRIKPNH